MKRTVAKLIGKQKFDFFDEEIPMLGPHDLLIKTISVGLCHSDVPAWLGDGIFGVNAHGYHYMVSDISYPASLGHEPVGQIVDIGSEVSDYKAGDYVTGCIDDAFATYLIADERGLVVKIPEMKKPVECCLGEPLMCVSNIVQAMAPVFGDRTAIIGSGFMGLMILNGVQGRNLKELTVIDLKDDRLALAKKYGATSVINPAKEDVEEAAYSLTDGRGFDQVVEITGSLKGLGTAASIIRIAKIGEAFGQGKIVAPSVYAKPEVWDPKWGYNLMFRSPIIHIVHPWYAVDYRDTLKKAVDAYASGIYPAEDLISHRIPFSNIETAFDLLTHNSDRYTKGIVTFG